MGVKYKVANSEQLLKDGIITCCDNIKANIDDIVKRLMDNCYYGSIMNGECEWHKRMI